MEHSSRKETYQRKRSLSKRKSRRQLITFAFFAAFSALVFVLWLTYNGADKQNAGPDNGTKMNMEAGSNSETPGTPSNPSTPGTVHNAEAGGQNGQAGKPDTGGAQNPNGRGEAPKGNAENTGKTAGTEATSGTSVNAGQGGGNPENTGKPPAVEPPAVAPVGGGGSGNNEMEDPSRVQLTFVGDVIFSDNVETALKTNGYDYPYRHVRSYLEKADLTIANLETPITERGTAEVKQYAYRSSPKALPAFKEAGFDLVNLANNHVLDYGVTGLLDTFDHLDKAGIRWFGAGRNAADAFKPVIVEKKGIKIAFLGLSKVVPTQEWKAGPSRPGVADTYALKLPLEAIRNAKKQADLVIVIPHWGIERQDQPEKYQKDFAREYIDAGADLVVGGHPHVLQGFENYNGKWIAYSLGNFIFTMNENPLTWETIILQASCSKEGGCALKAVPVLSKLANPEPMADDAAAKLYKRLTDISFQAEVGGDGSVKQKEKR